MNTEIIPKKDNPLKQQEANVEPLVKNSKSNIEVSPPTPIVDAIYEQAKEINKTKRAVIDETTKRCRDMNTDTLPNKDNPVRSKR